jgi:hypothetical protein
MQEVTVNGQTFAVSEAMAAAINADQEQSAVRVNDLTAGLEAARVAAVTPTAPAEPGVSVEGTAPMAQYNWETKLFEAPAEAMREAINIAKNEAKEEIRVEYAQTRAQENARADFWSDFYEKNDFLKGREKVVDFIVQRDGDLAAMSLEKAGLEIKNRTTAFLAEAGVTIPGGDKPPPIVEGGPEKAPKTEAAQPQSGDKPKSLGSVLRKRSTERAEARRENIKMVK